MKALLAVFGAAILFALFEFVFPGLKTWLRQTRTSLRVSTLPKNEYIIVNDIKLEYRGKLIGIDYAVVSRFGIFVIQEKPWGGRIFGKTGDEFWIRTSFGKEHKFRNPLSRSRTQIAALQSFLGYDGRVFLPIVVFSGGGSAWVDSPVPLIPGYRLKKTVQAYTKERLDYMQVQDAAIRLGEL